MANEKVIKILQDAQTACTNEMSILNDELVRCQNMVKAVKESLDECEDRNDQITKLLIKLGGSQ